MEVRPERLEPEVEGRHDPEVPAGAAQAPEQLGLLGLARAHKTAIRRDQLDAGQVVDREAEPSLQPADSTAERQPRDARVPDDADRAHETVGLGRDVELAEEGAPVHPRRAGHRVDDDPSHRRQVDHHAAIAARLPGGAVASGSDGQLEVVLATEADRGGDLGSAPRPDEDGGPAIVERVPEPSRIVIGRVGRRDHLAAKRSPQLIEVASRERGGRVGHGEHPDGVRSAS